MLFRNVLSSLFLVSVVSSCSPTSKEIVVIKYFDVPGFFKKEVEMLTSKSTEVYKVLSTDGQTSSLTIIPNWEKELAVFSSINLNKSSYIGKYQVDTIERNGSILVNYNALEKGLPVKNLSYSLFNEQISWVAVNKVDKSMILSTELHLRYVPDSGYTVSGSQQIGSLQPNEYSVSAIFAKNQ